MSYVTLKKLSQQWLLKYRGTEAQKKRIRKSAGITERSGQFNTLTIFDAIKVGYRCNMVTKSTIMIVGMYKEGNSKY